MKVQTDSILAMAFIVFLAFLLLFAGCAVTIVSINVLFDTNIEVNIENLLACFWLKYMFVVLIRSSVNKNE